VKAAKDALGCVVGKCTKAGRVLEEQSALLALQKAVMEQTEKTRAQKAQCLKLEGEKKAAELALGKAVAGLIEETKFCHEKLLVLESSSESDGQQPFDSNEVIATQRIGTTTNNPMQGAVLPHEILGSVTRKINRSPECGAIADDEEVRFDLDQKNHSVSFVGGLFRPPFCC
jgi:hypothetical protein